MPINPQIPLGGGGGGGFNTQSPFQILGQLYSMQGMRDEAADRRLQRRERERKAMDVETLDRAYAADKTRDGVISKLPGHLVPQANKFFDDLEEAENKRLEANSEAVATMALKIKELPEEGRFAAYVAATQWAVARDPKFYGPQVDAQQAVLAKITDPVERGKALNQMIESMAVGGKKYSETTNAQANRRREATAAELAVPQLARAQSEAASAQLENTAQRLAATTDPNEYRLLRQTMPMGMSFPEKYNYDRIIEIGQNPNEQATNKRLNAQAAINYWKDVQTVSQGWAEEGRQRAKASGVDVEIKDRAQRQLNAAIRGIGKAVNKGDYGSGNTLDHAAIDEATLKEYNAYLALVGQDAVDELPSHLRTPVRFPVVGVFDKDKANKRGEKGMYGVGGRGQGVTPATADQEFQNALDRANPPPPMPPIGAGPSLGGLMPPEYGIPPPPPPGGGQMPMGPPPMGPQGGIPSSLGPQGGMGNPPFGGVGGAQVRGGTAPGVPNPANAPRSQFVDPNWPPRPAPGAAPALPGNIIAPPRPPGPPAPPAAGGPQLGSLFGGRGMPFAPIEPTPGVLGGQASQPPPGPPAQPLGLAGAMPQVPPQPMNPLAQFGNQNIPEDVAQVLGNPKTKPGTYDLEIDGQVQVWDKDRYGNIRRLR